MQGKVGTIVHNPLLGGVPRHNWSHPLLGGTYAEVDTWSHRFPLSGRNRWRWGQNGPVSRRRGPLRGPSCPTEAPRCPHVHNPLLGGVAAGRGGFPQAHRRSRTHPAAPRHKEEACPPTAKHMLDTFPLSLRGGDLLRPVPRIPGLCKTVVSSAPGGRGLGCGGRPARQRDRYPPGRAAILAACGLEARPPKEKSAA